MPAVPDSKIEQFNAGTLPPDELFDQVFAPDPPAVKTRVMSTGDIGYQKLIDSRHDRMTKEEEAELGLSISIGRTAEAKVDAAHKARRKPNIRTEELVLDGRRARNELVSRTLPLAAWFVRETMDLRKKDRLAGEYKAPRGKIVPYLYMYSGVGIDYDDRMQMASEGLVIAADKYRGDRSFAQTSLWQMERSLMHALNSPEDPNNIPAKVSENMNKVIKLIEKYEASGIGKPSYLEIGRELGLDALAIARLAALHHASQRISLETVRLHLDRKNSIIGYEPDTEVDVPQNIEDLLVDDGVDRAVAEEGCFHQMGSHLDEAMADLGEEDQRMLEMRFGFIAEPMTLGEVGNVLGVGSETVRQREAKVLSMLRHPIRSRALLGLMEDEEQAQYSLRPILKLTEDDDAVIGITRCRPYSDDELDRSTSRRVSLHQRSYTIKEMRELA